MVTLQRVEQFLILAVDIGLLADQDCPARFQLRFGLLDLLFSFQQVSFCLDILVFEFGLFPLQPLKFLLSEADVTVQRLNRFLQCSYCRIVGLFRLGKGANGLPMCRFGLAVLI